MIFGNLAMHVSINHFVLLLLLASPVGLAMIFANSGLPDILANVNATDTNGQSTDIAWEASIDYTEESLWLETCEGQLLQTLDELAASQRTVYFNTIRRAQWALKADEIEAMRGILAESPEELRDWEWRWFQAQTDKSLMTYQLELGFGSVHHVEMDFNSNGSLLVTSKPSGRLAIVFETSTGRQISRLGREKEGVEFACFSPRADHVITTDRRGNCIIWDARSGEELLSWGGHMDEIEAAAFSSSGESVATISRDGNACVWNAETGDELHRFEVRVAYEPSVQFSPDGKKLATEYGLWDLESEAKLASFDSHTSHVRSVDFSPDSALVITASWDKTAKLWDSTTGAELAVLEGHTGCIDTAVFNHSGSRIVTASWDKTAKVWDTKTRKAILTLEGHSGEVCYAIFSPDDTRIATASWDGSVRIWDAGTGKSIANLQGHRGRVEKLAFSSDGKMLISGSRDGTGRLWDATMRDDGDTRRCHGGGVRDIAYSPDESRVATASWDGKVKIWDGITGDYLATLHGHNGRVASVEFSPDGTLILTASWDRLAKIWNADTGQNMLTLAGHEGWLFFAGFSPDGSMIVTTSSDQTVRIWDAGTGVEIYRIAEKYGWPFVAAFDSTGNRVAIAQGYTVFTWDIASGSELSRMEGGVRWTFQNENTGHSGRVTFVAFSKDGQHVITASEDGTLRTWDNADGEEIRQVRLHEARWVDNHIPIRANLDELYSIRIRSLPLPVANQNGSRLFKYNAVYDMVTGRKLCALPSHAVGLLAVAMNSSEDRITAGYYDGSVRSWYTSPYSELFEEREAARNNREKTKPLVAKLHAQVKDWSQVADMLRADNDISPEIRQQALNIVLKASSTELEQRWLTIARLGILGLQLENRMRPEVDAVIQLNKASEKYNSAISEAIENGDVEQRILACWNGVRQSGVNNQLYGRVLKLMKSICEEIPGDYYYLHILALAQYRMSQYEEAMATLNKAEEIPYDKRPPRAQRSCGHRIYAIRWPIWAMVTARLDQFQDARRYCMAARNYLDRRTWWNDEELLGLINEAEAIIFKASQDAIEPKPCCSSYCQRALETP